MRTTATPLWPPQWPPRTTYVVHACPYLPLVAMAMHAARGTQAVSSGRAKRMCANVLELEPLYREIRP